MADKKISELTELTTPDGTEELVVNDSGVSKKITQANLLSLADNVKATFGASDDLQIWHSSADNHTYIDELGTGNLRIRCEDFRLQNAAGSESYIQATNNGNVSLYHNNSAKLATTSTGIDVTGSVTCDGFTSTGIDDNATSNVITIGANKRVNLEANSEKFGLYLKYNAATNGCYLGSPASNAFSISAATGAERMRIDSSGNVGIGVTNVGAPLDIGSANPKIRLTDTGGGYSELRGNGGVMTLTADAGNTVANSAVTFETDGSERMRIDSSGNLLVGTTNADVVASNVVGINLKNDGKVSITRDGSFPLHLNRKTSDGEIIQFRKDGTTVGSIGTGTGLYFTAANGGFRVHSGGTKIFPCTASNAAKDNAIDLGAGDARFKDAYLSGGVYLGGTGSANKLDDYEEGTWTPVVEGATSAGTCNYVGGERVGTYTKIGDIVTLTMYISYTSHTGTGSLSITGLPYSSESGSLVAGVGALQCNSGLSWTSGYQVASYIPASSATIRYRATNPSGGSFTNVQVPSSFSYFRATLTYKV